MNVLTVTAPAKVNLFLEVNGKRPDGYHEITTVMQTVSLADILTFERTDGEGISLFCTDPRLSCGKDNLIVRAAEGFFALTGERSGLRITLEKKIPMQAGMGGGSADAAATLRALASLSGKKPTEKELLSLAASLGADVPFCMTRGARLCTGIGEKMISVPAMPDCFLVAAIKAGDAVSTAEAYRRIDALSYAPRPVTPVTEALERGSLSPLAGQLFNRFGQIAPSFARGEAILRGHGAKSVLLCGSGAAFFGIFENEHDAGEAKRDLVLTGYSAWEMRPVRE